MRIIKETVITETNAKGHIVRRIRTIEEREYTDRDYDWDTMRGHGYVPNVRSNRIQDAYEDYLRSFEW